MSTETEAVDIWNSYYDKYGVEPKNSVLLLKYVNNWQQHLNKINYKMARSIFNTYKGKGRLRDKLQNTATDIIETLPTKKAKRDANTQNIVQLVSVFKLQLLINGYIRNMGQSFLYIIPETISHLCLNYCHLPNIIIVLHESKQIQIVDLIHEKLWKCRLNHLNSKTQATQSTKRNYTKWSVSSGFCYASCVNLPLQISKTYTQKTSDIIFQSQQHYSDAILFDYSHIQYESDAPFDLYQYNLPLISVSKRQFVGNSLCFDPNIGLVSIGGGSVQYPYSRNVHLLKWEDVGGNHEWKWQLLPDVQFARGMSSCVLIEDKVMIVSGATVILQERGASFQYQNSTELYDLTKKQSKLIASANKPRFSAGACYDKSTKTVYLGGGVCGLYGNKNKSVESYDTSKDKWYAAIPNTSTSHKRFPILWTQNNGDLLFIGSMDSQLIEYIDLRVYGAKWNVMRTQSDTSVLDVLDMKGNRKVYRMLK
eukprot:35248_1